MYPIKLKSIQQAIIQDEQEPAKTHSKLQDAEGYGSGKMGYGPKKHQNQDCFNYFQINRDSYFYAIYDGHGKQGKEAGQATNDYIQMFLEKELKYLEDRYDEKKIEKLLKQAFSSAEGQLKSSGIDYSDSGTCAIGVLIIQNQCNSRAVLYQETDKEHIAYELSCDHRPTNPDERSRILQHNGIIEQYKFEGKQYGPERIWRNVDGLGLTTTRTFGNLSAKAVGIISYPEIYTHLLSVEDKFIVLGSDGLWDVMNSEEVCEFIRTRKQNDSVVDELIQECRGRWDKINQNKEPHFLVGDSVIDSCDDISIIIVYLRYKQQ